MTINSEPIYAAVFALAQTVTTWKVAERRLRHPDDLDPDNDYPALLQVQVSDHLEPDKESQLYGLKSSSEDILRLHFLIFVHAGAGNEWAASVLNPILDGIKAAFAVSDGRPGEQHFQTLGGLVQYATVSGTISMYETVRGTAIMAIVPIKILAFN